MAPRTENLAIMFTDIAGFTALTSRQSREENQTMLKEHDQLMLAVVSRYGGRRVKSIGDALLVVFKSPTDGVHCAMAMQDALHEYNRHRTVDKQIHIRVALSMGEVRVQKGDVFGEPVNIAARVEGETPADEIYFSDAVYLSMNKAEVPSEFVGEKTLKGIPDPVRIYRVPRFQVSRLMPVSEAPPPTPSAEAFPYGGRHNVVPAHINQLQNQLRGALNKGAEVAGDLTTKAVGHSGTFGESALAYLQKLDRQKAIRMTGAVGSMIMLVFLLVSLMSSSPLKKAEADMKAGKWQAVESFADELLKKNPENAEALLLKGHVQFSHSRRSAGLANYEKALKLKGGLRKDTRLLENTVGALGHSRKAATALLVAYPSSPAKKALKAQTEKPGYWARLRSAEVLKELKDDASINPARIALLDLEDAPDCAQRRAAIGVLRQYKVKAALPKLKQLAATSGVAKHLGSDSCLVDEAGAAVREIEGK
jgi:class 3 adenylate cyclase/tetratricopeptide (TPR) repeat protein